MINGLPPVLSSTDLKGRTSVTRFIREADVPGRKSDHIAPVDALRAKYYSPGGLNEIAVDTKFIIFTPTPCYIIKFH